MILPSSPPARVQFAAMTTEAEESLDLAATALLIAAEEYPQLSPAPYLDELDRLAERVRQHLGEETAPLLVLQEMSRVLFREERFRGNAEAYHDPRNSFLNDVLDRRVGIPISLSLVCLEVGWRLGLPLQGVGFPGHFLIRYEGEVIRVLLDPFEEGRLRFEDEAQTLLDRVYGGLVRLQPEFLESTGKKDMLARLLKNLKAIYLNAGEDAKALAAIERILLLRPVAVELRDRGMLLARAGRAAEAVADLEEYLTRTPDATDARRVRNMIEQLARG
jgi:regulator of sirC expression with transglutaminase-like and TPR domain